jgi:hypothetical protein
LHDESARILIEYEGAEAHIVSVDFQDQAEAKRFKGQAAEEGPIAAMRAAGYESETRRVILNQITMAMVSDCLHHIYEALRCLEKRKIVVALNLLRKPLTDNLLYLSWMLGDEDEFYRVFTTNSPRGLTASILKARRAEILGKALAKTEIAEVLTVGFIDETLFARANQSGFQKLFQHAVHLITVERVELKTTPENFNFIFKNYADDDLYDLIYDVLPHILLYLGHVVIGLFDRIASPEAGGKRAYDTRSILGLYLVEGGENEAYALGALASLSRIRCGHCQGFSTLTPHNAGRLLLTESYRCTKCRVTQAFPFSWLFEAGGDLRHHRGRS